MKASDVGCYYLDENGDLWRLMAFCEFPTATMERVNETPGRKKFKPERRGGAVGSPILDGFRKLVPEEWR